MASNSIVRKIDKLGRIVLPKEYCKELGLSQQQPLEVVAEGGSLRIQPLQQRCILCGGSPCVVALHEKSICQACLDDLCSGSK